MRGTISREHPWEVMPDLYFYRDPEEVKIIRLLKNHVLRITEAAEHLRICYCKIKHSLLTSESKNR